MTLLPKVLIIESPFTYVIPDDSHDHPMGYCLNILPSFKQIICNMLIILIYSRFFLLILVQNNNYID